jgi:PEP-CTERM motif
MKNIGTALLASVAMLAFALPALSEEVTFDLSNVEFACVSCPQTATGSFDFNTVTHAVSDVAIFTTGPDPSIGFLDGVPPEYTSGVDNYNGGLTTFLFMNSGDFSFLYLAPGDLVSFSSPTQLSLNGAMAVSQEIGQSDTWQRYVTGGSIDPVLVPEPSALALFASGLGLLGWLAWYRRRKAPALFGASA